MNRNIERIMGMKDSGSGITSSPLIINGEYKFKDEPLASIVKRLENYYNVNIHLDDKRLEKIRYTGTFSLDQDILDVFRIIDYEKQFTFKRVKKDIFITSK